MGDNPMVDSVDNAPVRRSLGAVMSELARTLQREHASEHDTLAAVTAAAVQAVPGAENATITLMVGPHQGADARGDRCTGAADG